MLKRTSANEDEPVHIRARQAVALNSAHLRARKLRHAIDLPPRFLNMFDNAGQLKQTIPRRHAARSKQKFASLGTRDTPLNISPMSWPIA